LLHLRLLSGRKNPFSFGKKKMAICAPIEILQWNSSAGAQFLRFLRRLWGFGNQQSGWNGSLFGDIHEADKIDPEQGKLFMNLAHNLEMTAQFYPNHPAVRERDRETTYAQLNGMANRVASALVGIGIAPGDLVALCAPNSADWLAVYFGVLKAGAVATTISSILTSHEFSNLINHAKPRVVYTDETKLDALERIRHSAGVEKAICRDGDMDLAAFMATGSPSFRSIERERRDPIAVLYTGGTTGSPKGVMLTQEGMDFSCQSNLLYERYTHADVSLCFLPLNHVFGQIYVMNPTILSGGCLELMPGFDMDRVLWLLDNDRLTRFYAVPTVFTRLIDVPDISRKFEKVRYCFSGGAAMSAGILGYWKELTGITIADGYGQTEFMPITYNHYHLEHHVPGSVGQPVFGVEMQIRDEEGRPVPDGEKGEISVRGTSVMKGYLHNPEATREAFWKDGWLRTGDVGLLDSKGFVYIVDRLKDMIVTGGENVYPREIEEAIYTRADIEDCAVVGVPDQEWGEKVVAYLVPRRGQIISVPDLKDFLKGRLSAFKLPKEYLTVKELPKSSQGKILRKEVRKLYGSQNK
jgi:long-chain acyl-CoA synthetase